MTSKDYNEYSKYYMYLQSVIREQEVYLPTQEMKTLAEKLFENLKIIVLKQFSQLQQVFDYRFYRYLFKEGSEN